MEPEPSPDEGPTDDGAAETATNVGRADGSAGAPEPPGGAPVPAGPALPVAAPQAATRSVVSASDHARPERDRRRACRSTTPSCHRSGRQPFGSALRLGPSA